MPAVALRLCRHKGLLHGTLRACLFASPCPSLFLCPSLLEDISVAPTLLSPGPTAGLLLPLANATVPRILCPTFADASHRRKSIVAETPSESVPYAWVPNCRRISGFSFACRERARPVAVASSVSLPSRFLACSRRCRLFYRRAPVLHHPARRRTTRNASHRAPYVSIGAGAHRALRVFRAVVLREQLVRRRSSGGRSFETQLIGRSTSNPKGSWSEIDPKATPMPSHRTDGVDRRMSSTKRRKIQVGKRAVAHVRWRGGVHEDAFVVHPTSCCREQAPWKRVERMGIQRCGCGWVGTPMETNGGRFLESVWRCVGASLHVVERCHRSTLELMTSKERERVRSCHSCKHGGPCTLPRGPLPTRLRPKPLSQLSYELPCVPLLPPTRLAFQVLSPRQSRMHVSLLLPPTTRWRWRWRVVLPCSHPLLSPCLSRVWHLDPGEDEVCPRT